ncbi:MAG: FAD-dependent oxidoreductase, partial [Allosphingosinicella sp.]
MLIDLSGLPGPLTRETEICIIGAGAAGLTLARRLLKLGHELILLESGGDEYEAVTADLNAGENVGEDYYQLDHARLRFFGGTTAIWGGRCAELDPIDLETRPWLPHSGWPISHEELRRYYREARPLLDLPEEAQGADALREAGVPIPAFDEGRLSVPVWDFDARFNRFGIGACADL